MAKRIVVDPRTRIEGHLRIEVEVEKNVNDKGKYLHPKSYGKSIESGINYDQNRDNIE